MSTLEPSDTTGAQVDEIYRRLRDSIDDYRAAKDATTQAMAAATTIYIFSELDHLLQLGAPVPVLWAHQIGSRS